MNHNSIEKLFRALANRKRLEIIKLLKRRPMPVIDIHEQIKLSYKATYQHVFHLAAAGFLDKERKSVLVYYFIDRDLSKTAQILLDLVK